MNDILARAQKTTREILKAHGIEKVIYIDDVFDSDQIDTLVVELKNITEADFNNLELEILWIDEPEILKDRIKTFLESDANHLQQILDKLADCSNSSLQEISRDDLCSNQIQKLIVNLIPLGVQKWESTKQTTIQESKDNKTLFIFDQDLNNGKEGIQEAVELLKENNQALFGILTHSIPLDGQIAKRSELSELHGLNKESFFVISKESLYSDPIHFPHFLSLTLLSPCYPQLKTQVKDIIQKAHEQTLTKLDNVDIETYDHILRNVAKAEGVWPPDMMLDIYSMYYAHEARVETYNQNTTLSSITDAIISATPTPIKEIIPSQTSDLERQRRFVDGDILNTQFIPTGLGDIFEVENKTYILLNQPCSLMLRSGGTRSQEETLKFFLCRIQKCSEDNEGDKFSELDFLEGESDFFTIKFSQILYLDPLIADLAVLSGNGEAVWEKDKPELSLTPSLKKRQKNINKNLNRLLTQYNDFINISSGMSTPKKQAIEKRLCTCSSLQAQINTSTKEITFPLKRIKRLNQDYASALLQKLSTHLSRSGLPRTYNSED